MSLRYVSVRLGDSVSRDYGLRETCLPYPWPSVGDLP